MRRRGWLYWKARSVWYWCIRNRMGCRYCRIPMWRLSQKAYTAHQIKFHGYKTFKVRAAGR